jgi:hypothetical protein
MQAAPWLAMWDSLKPKSDSQSSKRPARPVIYTEDEDNLDDVFANIASVRKLDRLNPQQTLPRQQQKPQR